jgi:nucleotide-binding universal stress UspA family protein
MAPGAARHSLAPVTSPAGAPLFERIVVGVDSCSGGRDALALAARLGHIDRAEIFAVRVHPYERNVDLAHPESGDRPLAERLRAELERELASACVAAHAVVVSENSPGIGLHRIAARYEARLIVVGASHLDGSERFLVGDDATGTLHGARCFLAAQRRAGLTPSRGGAICPGNGPGLRPV